MDIENLKDFVTLVTFKSFSKAAAVRNVTQPAFSRRIQSLELETGALIERHNQQFSLTLAGERFLLYAKQMLSLSEQALKDLKDMNNRMHYPVYLAMPAYLSKVFFPYWYKSLQKNMADLTMSVMQKSGSQALEALQKEVADFALITTPCNEIPDCYDLIGLQSKKVGNEKMIVVGAKRLEDRNKLLMHPQGSFLNHCAENILKPAQSGAEIVFETSSTGLLKEMAIAGFGLAVIPQSLIEDEISQGFLVVDDEFEPMECDILLVKNNRTKNDKIEKIWSFTQSIAD